MKYDVVVVGAGPGGATAAKVLAEKGVSVLLLDKHMFPRDKPCGGGLPARVLKRYPYLEKNGLVESLSYGICIHSTKLQHQPNLDSSTPIAGMVLRKPFDAGLVTLASEAGATFQGGKAAVKVTADPQHAMVTLEGGTIIGASYVIAADGAASHMARQLGHPQDSRNIGACVLEEYPVSQQVMDKFFGDQRRLHIYLNASGIAGYGWVFPKKEHLNIGVGEFYQALGPRQPKHTLKTAYAQFLELLKTQKVIPDTVHPVSPKGGVFPTRPQRRTYGSRSLLCGDAGGLTQPLTGEGIYYAMISGELAGKALVNALGDEQSASQSLAMYQRWWTEEFGHDYKRYYQVSKHWQSPGETIVKIIEKDPKVQAIGVSLFTDHIMNKDIRWVLGRRLIIDIMKNWFGRL